MDVVIICLAFFFGIPALFGLVMYLEEEKKISEKEKYIYIIGICLIPYIASALFIGDGFQVFWIAYTIMMLITFVIIGIIKLFQK